MAPKKSIMLLALGQIVRANQAAAMAEKARVAAIACAPERLKGTKMGEVFGLMRPGVRHTCAELKALRGEGPLDKSVSNMLTALYKRGLIQRGHSDRNNWYMREK